jgi:hypothetical protein
MANFMYQNVSEEMRLYHNSDGAKRIVVPDEVFESDIEQTSGWFKLVDESSFRSVEPDEPVEEKHKHKRK